MISQAADEPRNSFWRSLHALNITRVVIAGMLLAFWWLGENRSQLDELLSYRNICAAYLLLAILLAFFTLRRRRHFQMQLLTQIAMDIGFVSLLYLASGGIRGGMAILFFFPLASAAILTQTVLALFFASVVSLFMLAENAWRILHNRLDASLMQAGLFGAAFLSTVFVVNRLAAKLIRQESLAAQRGQDLMVQQTVNNLVIADMDDGVLVVGDDGTIYACNPSAGSKLHLSPDILINRPKLGDISALTPLADAFQIWRAKQFRGAEAHSEPVAFLVIKPLDSDSGTDASHALGIHLKVRFAGTGTDSLAKGRNVIFLQDMARIEHQAQQLKLASMGRLTASIAHEVRNPLAAIAHASALLSEEESSPGQKRLLKIIADNVSRMDRMVEDILNMSRKAQFQETVDLMAMLSDIKAFFDELHRLPSDMVQIYVTSSHAVRFDPIHLREVVLNLLNNALRYASGRPGSILIRAVQATPSRLELHFQDDGPSITPQVRAHLFEPFYTTSSKGTGLGLYLARELCSNNGAMLDYEFHSDEPADPTAPLTGRFVISFATIDPSDENAPK